MGFLKIPLSRTITDRKIESNPLYLSSYKPPYLSPTHSTTPCQKNYLERPQSIETINKKKKENRTGKNKEGNLWCQALHCQFFLTANKDNIRERGLEMFPPPHIYFTLSKFKKMSCWVIYNTCANNKKFRTKERKSACSSIQYRIKKSKIL